MNLTTKLILLILCVFIFGTTALYFAADILGGISTVLDKVASWIDGISWLRKLFGGV
jgi:hypothetical protein